MIEPIFWYVIEGFKVKLYVIWCVCVKCGCARKLDKWCIDIGKVIKYQVKKVLVGWVARYQAEEGLVGQMIGY